MFSEFDQALDTFVVEKLRWFWLIDKTWSLGTVQPDALFEQGSKQKFN